MTAPTFVDMCRSELSLCGIEAGSTVAVLSQGNERPNYVNAFLQAARELEATALPPAARRRRTPRSTATSGTWSVGETPLAGNRPAIEALKVVDLVVDTVFLLFSKEQMEIQESGTRVLACIEPIDHLREMFPGPRLRERVEFGGELLGQRGAAALHQPRTAPT